MVIMQAPLCSSSQLKRLPNLLVFAFVVLSVLDSTATRPLLPEWNIITSSPALARKDSLSLNITLEYYVQVLIGGVDIGVLISAIDPNTTGTFGYTELFAFNITEEADATSTQLGYVRGFNIQASYDSTVYGVEVETVSYADDSLNGTIQIQGLIIAGTNEVAIVGGTGDFRGARGYGIVTLVNATDDLVLYHHELNFL